MAARLRAWAPFVGPLLLIGVVAGYVAARLAPMPVTCTEEQSSRLRSSARAADRELELLRATLSQLRAMSAGEVEPVPTELPRPESWIIGAYAMQGCPLSAKASHSILALHSARERAMQTYTQLESEWLREGPSRGLARRAHATLAPLEPLLDDVARRLEEASSRHVRIVRLHRHDGCF